MNKISPSVMCINPLELKEQLIALNDAKVDQYHIDIMDGHFVPNFSLNTTIIQKIKEISNTVIDVHLMIDNPDLYIKSFADAGADIIIPHLEALIHPIRTLKSIKALSKKAGVAINPATEINTIPHLIDYLDIICVMTVEPGFSGQAMIPSVISKIQRLKEMIVNSGRDIDIMVDGQIMETTAPILIKSGANVLVMGSSGLFNHPREEYAQVVQFYKNIT